MNVILTMVESADGKTTFWKEPHVYGWSSPEDREHFLKLRGSSPVVVMGKDTYESVKSSLEITPKTRRIILTGNPETYASVAVAGQLEFSSESPSDLVTRLNQEGYASILLVGGSRINKAFLSDQLITECYITIEPKFFGTGKSIFDDYEANISLELLDLKQLNTKGTVVLHYRLRYEH